MRTVRHDPIDTRQGRGVLNVEAGIKPAAKANLYRRRHHQYGRRLCPIHGYARHVRVGQHDPGFLVD